MNALAVLRGVVAGPMKLVDRFGAAVDYILLDAFESADMARGRRRVYEAQARLENYRRACGQDDTVPPPPPGHQA